LNSIHGVQKAITYEINRQISILETGGSIEQETLLYNAADGKCYPMRSKEESHDYRYFPDPDLVTLEVSQEWINRVAASLPELPLHRRQRFVEEYQIPAYDAEVLTSTRALAEYFEETAELVQDPKAVSNWIMTEVMARLNEQQIIIDEFAIKPERLGDLIKMTLSNEITGPIAKEVFAIMQSDPAPPDVIVDLRGLAPLTDSGELEKLVDQIIAENPEEVARFRAGHKKLMGFFVGNVMKATQGKADPKLATQLFNRKLGESQ